MSRKDCAANGAGGARRVRYEGGGKMDTHPTSYRRPVSDIAQGLASSGGQCSREALDTRRVLPAQRAKSTTNNQAEHQGHAAR